MRDLDINLEVGEKIPNQVWNNRFFTPKWRMAMPAFSLNYLQSDIILPHTKQKDRNDVTIQTDSLQ